jgi:hypothetical protein
MAAALAEAAQRLSLFRLRDARLSYSRAAQAMSIILQVYIGPCEPIELAGMNEWFRAKPKAYEVRGMSVAIPTGHNFSARVHPS